MNLERKFYKILGDLNIDYSMGDYTNMTFDFIKSRKLEDEFIDYVCDSFTSPLEQRAYEERMEAHEDGKDFKPRTLSFEKLASAYQKGITLAEKDIGKANKER